MAEDLADAQAGPLVGGEHLAGDMALVEVGLREAVTSEGELLGRIAGHLIGAGGKRIRPRLTLTCARSLRGLHGEPDDDEVTAAVAIELVHLGSLYHDDVIDEAATRRGVESINAKWGNVAAILAGDYLFARASELASPLGTEVGALFARTISAMCRGQVFELEHEFDQNRTEEHYYESIAGKTGALMASACRVGAILSGVDRATVDGLTRFGAQLGNAFQVVDDLLDISSTAERLGKPVGHDVLEGVYTLPVLLAIRDQPNIRDLLRPGLDRDELDSICKLVRATSAIDQSHAVASDLIVSALGELDVTGIDGGAIEHLRWIASAVLAQVET